MSTSDWDQRKIDENFPISEGERADWRNRYKASVEVWQAGANIMTGPGLGTEPASWIEVVVATYHRRLRASLVEEVDEGVFLIPLTYDERNELIDKGHLGFEQDNIQFTLEMP